MALVTLAEIEDFLFDADHTATAAEQADLTRLRAAAVKAVEAEIGGPIEATVVTEYHSGVSGPLILRKTNPTSVATVTPTGGTVWDSTYYRLDGSLVRWVSGYGTYWGSEVEVTYTAGWEPEDVPEEVNQAVLRYVQWSRSRSHGGSESYSPAGPEFGVGLGIDGIRKEIRFVLGDLVSGPVIA